LFFLFVCLFVCLFVGIGSSFQVKGDTAANTALTFSLKLNTSC
jgi:hypothetical protein